MTRNRRALLLLLTTGSVLPWPVRAVTEPMQGNDAGAWQILSARYGTAARNVDVTERLRALATLDFPVKVDNGNLRADPAPGRSKTLRIYARGPGGQVRTFDYPEGTFVDGSQFSSWRSGNWGLGGYDGGWGAAPSGGPGSGAPGHGSNPGGGRDRDSGDYQILQARYGTSQRNVDVTDRLRELARQDRSFRLTNDTFGIDPHPGRVKTLRIYARGPGGQSRMFEYTEGRVVDGSQFTGWAGGNWGQGGYGGGWGGGSASPGYGGGSDRHRLDIVRATYGYRSQTRDVTSRLRSRVRDNRLALTVNRESMGSDPSPGNRKMLRVTYTVGGRHPQEVRVDEDEELRLP
jgi:hypothetical protein